MIMEIQVYVPESVPNDQCMGLIGRGTMAQYELVHELTILTTLRSIKMLES